jgi:hypothetical protein
MTAETCDQCSRPEAAHSLVRWNGRAYCRRCTERAQRESNTFIEADHPLEETIERNQVSYFRFLSKTAPLYLLVGLVLFGYPLTMLTLGRLQDVDAQLLYFCLALFGLLGVVLFVLFGLIGVPVHRSGLPRTIKVRGADLVVTGPRRETSVPLSECRWSFGKFADELYLFTGRTGGVTIHTPTKPVVCGYTSNWAEQWVLFLRLAEVPRQSTVGCARRFQQLALVILGGIIGTALGTVIGWPLVLFPVDPMLRFGLGFMGAIDGLAAVGIYVTCEEGNPREAKSRLHPAMLAASFGLVGMMCGRGLGLLTVALAAVLNALIGYALGVACRRRIDR